MAAAAPISLKEALLVSTRAAPYAFAAFAVKLGAGCVRIACIAVE